MYLFTSQIGSQAKTHWKTKSKLQHSCQVAQLLQMQCQKPSTFSKRNKDGMLKRYDKNYFTEMILSERTTLWTIFRKDKSKKWYIRSLQVINGSRGCTARQGLPGKRPFKKTYSLSSLKFLASSATALFRLETYPLCHHSWMIPIVFPVAT